MPATFDGKQSIPIKHHEKRLFPALLLAALLAACGTTGTAPTQDSAASSSCNTTTHEMAPAPLRYSAHEGDVQNVRCLLASGADANAADKKGNTALVLAAGRGHTAIVQDLLDKGANINATDKDGETALMHAAGTEQTATARFLIERGANIHATTKMGWTPLMRAAFLGHSDTVKLLLDKGAQVNATDERGGNALNHALAGASVALTFANDLVNSALKLGIEGADLAAIVKKARADSDASIARYAAIFAMLQTAGAKSGQKAERAKK